MKTKTIILILFAFILSNCNNINEKAEKNNNKKMIKSIVTVPIPNITIESTAYQIKSDCDTVIFYKTGSKLIIPENAFVDKDGKVITTKVVLKYREFSNAFDIYLGGIPMVYTENGVEKVFETAGMLEINATSAGKPLFPNPDKKIKIEMNSFQSGDQYNLYILDTITGKWKNIGKDIVETKKYNDELAKLPKIPPRPKRAGLFSFSVGDAVGNHPELSIYENVLFTPIDNKYIGFSGTDIQVKDLGNGTYQVTFILDAYGVHKEESGKCYLAFKEGVDYDNALKKYQKKYKNLIKKRGKEKKELEKDWEAYNTIKKQYYDAGLLDFFCKEGIKLIEGEEKIIRTIELSGFGFINCDHSIVYPQGAELIANYTDAKGNNIELNSIVLVEKGRNAIFRYTTMVKFSPSEENILWGITENGKLAYFKEDDFKHITQKTGNYTFKMTVHNQELKTYEEICNVLF